MKSQYLLISLLTLLLSTNAYSKEKYKYVSTDMIPTYSKDPVPVPMSPAELERRLVGSGPWLFIGYSKGGQLLEKNLGLSRRIYFQKRCFIEKTGMPTYGGRYSFTSSLVKDKSAQQSVTPLQIGPLQQIAYSDRDKIDKLPRGVDEGTLQKRFFDMMFKVTEIFYFSSDWLILQTANGVRLEFVNQTGSDVDVLKDLLCPQDIPKEAPSKK